MSRSGSGQSSSRSRRQSTVSACQSGGGNPTALHYPWKGERYDDDKSRFFRFVRSNRYNGHPTRLSEAVRYVYGENYSNTEYRRLSRFAKRTEWLETASAGGYVEVEPTPACFGTDSLEFRSKQSAKTQEGDRFGFDVSKTGPTADCLDREGASRSDRRTADRGDGLDGVEASTGPTAERFPKDRVRRVLDKRLRLDGGQYDEGHDYRREVFRELAQYRDDIGDKWTYFERIRGAGSPYLVLPYSTRYNDGEKARDTQRRYRTALRRASSRFDRAAVVSLTVDPNRHSSHSEATEAIRDGVSKWLQRESYQLGGRPDNLKVLDFQRNGLPHYHVVLFGVSAVDGGRETATGEATISTADVRDYWDDRADVGQQVDVRPAYCRGSGDDWILHDDGGRVSLGYYVGKRIRGLVELAGMDTDDLFSAVESGDLSLWRHVLFWAYEKQYCTASPALRADRDDGLPSVRIWRYVGACRFEQIPAQVLDNGVVCRPRPPPD